MENFQWQKQKSEHCCIANDIKKKQIKETNSYMIICIRLYNVHPLKSRQEPQIALTKCVNKLNSHIYMRIVQMKNAFAMRWNDAVEERWRKLRRSKKKLINKKNIETIMNECMRYGLHILCQQYRYSHGASIVFYTLFVFQHSSRRRKKCAHQFLFLSEISNHQIHVKP